MSARVILISAGRKWNQRAIERRNNLAAAHLYLVKPIAKNIGRRLPACFDLDDLVCAGMKGLMRAAERYEPAAHNNTPFPAFARVRISGEIIESVRRRHWKANVHPGIEEAPDRGAPPATDEELDKQRLLDAIRDAMSWLPGLQCSIVQGYYFDGRTLGQLAEELELNETRVATLRDQALAEIRRRVAWRGFRTQMNAAA